MDGSGLFELRAISSIEWPNCESASMYPLFLSPIHVSLFGGTTHCTGWKDRAISSGLLAGGMFMCAPAIFSPDDSAFFPALKILPIAGTLLSIKFGCSDPEGKLVWFAVIANTASRGDLCPASISNLRAASSGLL